MSTAAADLTDAEFAELDELLATTPAPLQALDASMLDGYLCGVIVQPRLIDTDEWLPNIFDYDGGVLPEDTDPEWLARVRELVERRHKALNRALVEDGWFDPVVLDLEAETDEDKSAESEQDTDYAALSPISRGLLPWVAGFQHACLCFPELSEMPDDAVMAALARLYRHLPAETPEEKEVVATLDREHPLKDMDDAIEELVMTVADLADLTEEHRYRVETLRRAGPKVGRNDACPCGSGRKYKQCHGAN
jgi:uncharacterized protein